MRSSNKIKRWVRSMVGLLFVAGRAVLVPAPEILPIPISLATPKIAGRLSAEPRQHKAEIETAYPTHSHSPAASRRQLGGSHHARKRQRSRAANNSHGRSPVASCPYVLVFWDLLVFWDFRPFRRSRPRPVPRRQPQQGQQRSQRQQQRQASGSKGDYHQARHERTHSGRASSATGRSPSSVSTPLGTMTHDDS